jgi:DNA mismatch repair protein MutS
MAGKSTYLLMAGLITLMAQVGSFVPADYARIGLVDRIFTRVGAQHDIAAGHSTFMVEMAETANILRHATPRSLIILDEIGRGTSTYDGISIARAVAEYIHNHPGLGCKTLFATHYHELTELEQFLPRVKNYRVDVLEEGNQVVFLRRVVSGGADRSYGIHVAKLAGVPRAVTRRAEEVLRSLEQDGSKKTSGSGGPSQLSGDAFQLSLFGEPDPVLEELKTLDVLSLTPLEAISKLFELQQKARAANVE